MAKDDLLGNKLYEYAKMFNDCFPIMCVNMSDEEIEKAIDKCLEEGKPYEVEFEEDVVY